jgi:hypothetical protein
VFTCVDGSSHPSVSVSVRWACRRGSRCGSSSLSSLLSSLLSSSAAAAAVCAGTPVALKRPARPCSASVASLLPVAGPSQPIGSTAPSTASAASSSTEWSEADRLMAYECKPAGSHGRGGSLGGARAASLHCSAAVTGGCWVLAGVSSSIASTLVTSTGVVTLAPMMNKWLSERIPWTPLPHSPSSPTSACPCRNPSYVLHVLAKLMFWPV